jgi:hypothetical protein
MPLKIVGEGNWRGDVPKDGNKKEKKAYSFEGRKKNKAKFFFLLGKKIMMRKLSAYGLQKRHKGQL